MTLRQTDGETGQSNPETDPNAKRNSEYEEDDNFKSVAVQVSAGVFN